MAGSSAGGSSGVAGLNDAQALLQAQATFVAQSIFEILDENQNDALDFEEFARWARVEGKCLEA